MDIINRILIRSDIWREDFMNYTSSRVDDLKTDEEKVKIALRYLTSYEKILSIEKPSKSTTKAREYNEEGEKLLNSLDWAEAIEIYSKAVMHAEIDSNELARAYADRSAALHICGFYGMALADIERALKICPNDHERAELYARRANCLFGLKDEMRPEIEEALADARKWLEKMNEPEKTKLTSMLNEFPEYASVNSPYSPCDYDILLPKPPHRDNPKIPGVSDAVELKYSEKFGRHVVATKTIKAGETIMVHRAYATVINSHSRHKYCWYCCKGTGAGIACHQCVDVIYCDENCRDKAWQEYHDIECSIIPSISNRQLSSLDTLTLRLTVKAYKEAGTLEKLQETIRKIDEIDDPLLKCLTDDVFDSSKYTSVYSLSRHTEDLFMNTVRASVILYALATMTNIFGERISRFEELSENKYAAFIGGLIKRNFEISLVNSTKLTLDGDVGLIVDPFWSMLNHNCDPTVVNYTSADKSALVALQRIQEGEQVFLSYGPEFVFDQPEERREALQLFSFNCDCTACINKWGPGSHLSFPSHKLTSLPTDLSEKMDYPPTFTDFSTDLVLLFSNLLNDEFRTISAAFDLLDFLHCTHGYPTKEIIELKLFVRESIKSVRPEY